MIKKVYEERGEYKKYLIFNDKIIKKMPLNGLDNILNALEEDKRYLPWNACNINDFRNYYIMFHEGKDKDQVRKEDFNFYIALGIRKLRDIILPGRKYKHWKNKTDKQLIEASNKKYKGLRKGQLSKVPSTPYKELRIRGLLDKVDLNKTPLGKFTDKSAGYLINYGKKKHAGKGRTQIAEDDRTYYRAARKMEKKAGYDILPETLSGKWDKMTFKEAKKFGDLNIEPYTKWKQITKILKKYNGFIGMLYRKGWKKKVLPYL